MDEQLNTSGQGKDAPVPAEIRRMGFNWGAMSLQILWAKVNGLTLIEGTITPGINLGWNGNELAWKYKRWESVEHFKHTQKLWSLVGLAVWLVGIVPAVVVFLLMGIMGQGYTVLSLIEDLVIVLVLGTFFFGLTRYMKPQPSPQSPTKIEHAIPLEEQMKGDRQLNLRLWIPILILIGFFVLIALNQ